MRMTHWTLIYLVLFIGAFCLAGSEILSLRHYSATRSELTDMLGLATDEAAKALKASIARGDMPETGIYEICDTFAIAMREGSLRRCVLRADGGRADGCCILVIMEGRRMYAVELPDSGHGTEWGEVTEYDRYTRNAAERHGSDPDENDRIEAVIAEILDAYDERYDAGEKYTVRLSGYDGSMFMNGAGDYAVMSVYVGRIRAGGRNRPCLVSSGTGIYEAEYVYGDCSGYYHLHAGESCTAAPVNARFSSFREAAESGYSPCPECVLQGIP